MFSVLYLETLPCRIASLNFNYSPNNESIECGIFLNDNRRDLSTRQTIEQLPGLSGTIASHRVKTGKLKVHASGRQPVRIGAVPRLFTTVTHANKWNLSGSLAHYHRDLAMAVNGMTSF